MAEEKTNSFEINPNRLDEEWVRQPRLTRQAGEREADFRHKHAQAKARLEVATAGLRLRILKDPHSYDLPPKPTKDDLDAAITLHPDYQESLKELNESKYELDLMSTDVTAMVDRRKALERLVELIAIDYYSDREPRPRSGASREVVSGAAKKSARAELPEDYKPRRERRDDD